MKLSVLQQREASAGEDYRICVSYLVPDAVKNIKWVLRMFYDVYCLETGRSAVPTG
jgi:hypothetical protein